MEDGRCGIRQDGLTICAHARTLSPSCRNMSHSSKKDGAFGGFARSMAKRRLRSRWTRSGGFTTVSGARLGGTYSILSWPWSAWSFARRCAIWRTSCTCPCRRKRMVRLMRSAARCGRASCASIGKLRCCTISSFTRRRAGMRWNTCMAAGWMTA